MNQRLRHDCAYAMATHLLEIVSPLLRGEERNDAFAEFYQVCLAGFEAFETQAQWPGRLSRPSEN